MPLFHKNSPGTSRMTEHTFCAKDHGLGRAIYPTFFLSRKIMIEPQVRDLNFTNKVHGCHACEIAYLFSKLYSAENPYPSSHSLLKDLNTSRRITQDRDFRNETT